MPSFSKWMYASCRLNQSIHPLHITSFMEGCAGANKTPFTEGCAGANKKASPPGRHQEQAPKQRCTFRPTTFSSVQFITVRKCKMMWPRVPPHSRRRALPLSETPHTPHRASPHALQRSHHFYLFSRTKIGTRQHTNTPPACARTTRTTHGPFFTPHRCRTTPLSSRHTGVAPIGCG